MDLQSSRGQTREINRKQTNAHNKHLRTRSSLYNTIYIKEFKHGAVIHSAFGHNKLLRYQQILKLQRLVAATSWSMVVNMSAWIYSGGYLR